MISAVSLSTGGHGNRISARAEGAPPTTSVVGVGPGKGAAVDVAVVAGNARDGLRAAVSVSVTCACTKVWKLGAPLPARSVSIRTPVAAGRRQRHAEPQHPRVRRRQRDPGQGLPAKTAPSTFPVSSVSGTSTVSRNASGVNAAVSSLNVAFESTVGGSL